MTIIRTNDTIKQHMNPKISILMTVYNGEKYLPHAIDSILAQTFTDFEFIIVNDGSKDKTLDIVRSYNDPRIVLLNNEKNMGLIDSLNRGLAKARGAYVARLDHDDIALPQRLATQYAFMEAHPDIDLVGSWTECIDSEGRSLKISRNSTNTHAIKYDFMFNNIMFHSSIFFRTDLVRNNGGYSKEFIHSEDYEMYSRPGKELRCANIPEVLFKLRLHNNSVTGSNTTQPTVYANALNIVHRNINQYAALSRPDFDRIVDIMVIKKPSSKTSLRTLLYARKFLKKLTAEFIRKNNLAGNDRELILRSYKGRNKMMWQHYLIGRYRALLGKN